MIRRALQTRPGADDPDAPFWRTVGLGALAGFVGYGAPHAAIFTLSLYGIYLAPIGLVVGPLIGGVVGLVAVGLARALMPQAAAPGRRLLFRCLLGILGALTFVHGATLERAGLGLGGEPPRALLAGAYDAYANVIKEGQKGDILFWVLFFPAALIGGLVSLGLAFWITRKGLTAAPAPRTALAAAGRVLAALVLGAYAASSGVLLTRAGHLATRLRLNEMLLDAAGHRGEITGDNWARAKRDAVEALKQGADPNAVETSPNDNSSALTLALNNQDAEIAGSLLDRGARPDPTGQFSLGCALADACRSGQPDLARLLLAHGAGPDSAWVDGTPALIGAAEQGDLPMVNLLLGVGANVNAADPAGVTALMNAAQEGHADVLRALLRAGADVNARTKAGATALTLTGQRETSEFAAQKTPEGQRAVWKKYAAPLRLLQESGARI